MNIREKLQVIQTEMKAPKGQYNAFGKYAYRKAEDILESLKPFLAKNNCSVVISEQLVEVGGFPVIVSTAYLLDSESEGAESSTASAGVEKVGAMQLPQAFGSASSYAKKYALGNLFAIDNEEDPDSMKPEPKKTEMPKAKSEPETAVLPKLSPRDTEKWNAAVAAAKAAKSVDVITQHRSLIPADLTRLKKEAGLA
jgi:hypothetical protein